MRTLLLLVALAAPAFAQGSIFPDRSAKKAARQLEARTIAAETRAFLRERMKSHAQELRELSVAVATVKFPEAQRLAQDLANEPRLDSSTGPATKLPPRFFELQGELKRNAQALVEASKASNMDDTLAGYHRVVETCMACHAAFRK